jgi:O-methyltransferase
MKLELAAREFFRNTIRSKINNEIVLQRLKMIWYVCGYFPILFVKSISIFRRLSLIVKVLKIDWNILHSHKPCEITKVFTALCLRPAIPGEVMIEAGCWKGGSSAKFSLLCKLLGYRLLIYDSFQGVEPLSRRDMEGEYDYSGEYEASLREVTKNIHSFGAVEVCQITEGWFSDTIASDPVQSPVRLVFIDCDLAKGTLEVLQGATPNLVDGAVIITQDYHIKSVRKLLHSSSTWSNLQMPFPNIRKECGNLALLSWES